MQHTDTLNVLERRFHAVHLTLHFCHLALAKKILLFDHGRKSRRDDLLEVVAISNTQTIGDKKPLFKRTLAYFTGVTDVEIIDPQFLDLRQRLFLGTFTNGGHDDHRAYPKDNAERGQK